MLEFQMHDAQMMRRQGMKISNRQFKPARLTSAPVIRL
jgi:hypothetical protein